MDRQISRAHRPWKPRSAWAILALAGTLTAPSLGQSQGDPGSAEPTTQTETDPAPGAEPIAPVPWDDIRSFIMSRCTTCHAAPAPDADLDLTIPSNVQREALEGRLLTRLNDADDPMPPDEMLPEKVRAAIASWVKAGASIEPQANPSTSNPRSSFWEEPDTMSSQQYSYEPIVPFDITNEGFEMLERLQGHWVGKMTLMGQDMPWFAFDYRAAGPAHVHGIFEGGTMGNLFNSFFYTRYKGVETLVARNGGILNGIYRTSYFVLDRVEHEGESTKYRFVDAVGGAGVMWMSLEFQGNSLEMRAYTSRMGERPSPTRHMAFTATRRPSDLAEQAARAVGFPNREPEFDLDDGLPAPDWGSYGPPTSASYLWQDREIGYDRMGVLSGDPVRIEHIPHLARLTVDVDRTAKTKGSKLQVYLSEEPFTDERGKLRSKWGYIEQEVFDTALMFPEIISSESSFTFTYLHPGEYHLTVVADLDKDGVPGTSDIVTPSRRITIDPGSHPTIRVDDLGSP